MKLFANPVHIFKRSALVALLCAPAVQPAFGHEYDSLIKARKYAEVERAVSAKLAVEANNADALIAKSELILIDGKVSRFDEAEKIAEQCIANHPKNSECHEALGNVLGSKAQTGGMMSGLSSLGRIRDSFKKAIELDPKNFNAMNSLVMYYLEVPGMLGGSTSKAKDVVAEAQKINPAAASIMQAAVDLKAENFDKARTGALAVNVNGSAVLAELQNNVLLQISQTYIRDKKFVEAEKLLREVTQRFPDSPTGYLGLGRALQEQGKFKESLPQLEKSLSIHVSASALYRLGKAWQALGDKAQAIAALEKSLATTPELGKKSRADAEEQVKALK